MHSRSQPLGIIRKFIPVPLVLSKSGLVTVLLLAGVVFSLVSCNRPRPESSGPQPQPTTSLPPAPATSAPMNLDPNAMFTASPNPVKPGSKGFAKVGLSFNTKVTQYVEVHVNAPNGPLLCQAKSTGTCVTDDWVTDGMTFFLQNSSAAKPIDPAATLATVMVHFQK